jgi:hypothetical protein
MSLTHYLHITVTSRGLDQLNIWHILLPQDLHMIISNRVFNNLSNWEMLLPRYLQMFVSVLVLADVTLKLSKDVYKTRVLQKNRKELLELNWTILELMNQRAHLGFYKSSELLGGDGRLQETATLIVGVLMLIFCVSRVCYT